MKTVKYILFVLGGLCLIFSHFLSIAPNTKWLLTIFCPNFVHAQNGYEKLESLDSLNYNNIGFKEISTLFAAKLTNKIESTQVVSWDQIKLISYKGSQGSYNTEFGIVAKLPVYFKFKNDQILEWDMKPLGEEIEQLRAIGFSTWSNVLFVIGLLLYLIEFITNQIKKDINNSSNPAPPD